MLRSPRVRHVAPVALLALTLGMPSGALAETAPTPSPTASTSAPAPTMDALEPTSVPAPTTTTATPDPSSTTTTPEPSTPATTPAPLPTTTDPEVTESAPAPATPQPATTPSATTSTTTPVAPAATPSTSATPSAAAPALTPAGRSSFVLPTADATQLAQARYSAHFLAEQLKANGNHLNFPDSGFGVFPDTGNTIDAILALDAAKAGGSAAGAATAWVEANVGSYIAFPGTPVSSGGTGKTLILASTQGRDVHKFGGFDLVKELTGLLTPQGRFGTKANDYDVTINQILPIIGLARAGVDVPAASVEFLGAQQCADGGVRGSLVGTGCTSDTDASAFAAQAFLAVGDSARATRVLDYLQARQQANGSLTNASGEGANANTTGVAAQAFALGGRAAARTKAASFIVGLQWGCTAPAAHRGAIAFTAADTKATKANLDKAIRATPQAVLALVAQSLVTVDNTGVAAGTTAQPCASGSATPTPTTGHPTSTTTSAPTGQPTTTAGPAAPGGNQAAGPGLAYTGASPVMPLLIATLLLLTGGALVLLSRRRGVHQ